MITTTLALRLGVVGLAVAAACSPAKVGGPDAEGDTTTSGAPEAVSTVLGVFVGTERPEAVVAYERWLGHRVGHVLEYVGGPQGRDPWSGIDDPSQRCAGWGRLRKDLVLSVRILPTDGQTLERGAAGRYNGHWRRFGSTLIEHGCAGIVLRLGWEFNGDFFPWAARGKEAEFAAYWREIVATLRSLPGQAFRFEWNVLAGAGNPRVEDAYPGDDVVDLIGLDAYDTSTFSTPDERWADQLDRKYGLRWHADFAAAHGKPMAFSEWGVTERPRDRLGGGDAPEYIERMIDWIADHDVAHAIYFDVDARDAAHRLSAGRFPRAAAAFKERVGVLVGARNAAEVGGS